MARLFLVDAIIKKLISLSNGDITIQPNGTGKVQLDGATEMPTAGDELALKSNTAHFTIQTITGSGSKSIDWRKGNKLKISSLTGAVTLSKTNPGGACALTVLVEQGSTGYGITWWSGIRWFDSSDHTWDSDNDAPDIDGASSNFVVNLLFDGTNYWGCY